MVRNVAHGSSLVCSISDDGTGRAAQAAVETKGAAAWPLLLGKARLSLAQPTEAGIFP